MLVAAVTEKLGNTNAAVNRHNFELQIALECVVGYLAGFTEICPRGSSLRARQRAIPDAYDARATRTWPVRRCGSPSAQADSESRERLHLDAIDATDADIVDAQYPKS